MAEVAISVAAKIAEYLVGPVLHHGKYLFCAGKVTKNVESIKEQLASKRESVQKRVKEANNRAEVVEDAVKRWLSDVEMEMKEVEELEKKLKEGGNFCQGWCPSKKGYYLCKQLSKKIVTMTELNENSNLDPFSHPAELLDIDYYPYGDFMYFKSTKYASQQLLEALRDDSVYKIGLYGMGGCGKTSLVKVVGKEAKKDLFDRVAFTTVSQTVNVKKIQGEIADSLSFTLRAEQEPGRATELSMRLRGGERILVILDDVWTELNFVDIGIPLDNHQKGCKVLLTTRRQQVCSLMDCQRNIPLNILSEEEAWSLFQKKADIVNDSSAGPLNGMAKDIAKECKGLPIAIVAVAISLKRKPLVYWKRGLHNLRVSKPIDMDERERDAYCCLRLSYDYLKSVKAKSLFLMCSMFPEDHDISIEELFRYGMGLNICKGADSFEMARNEVDVAIQDLIDSSLLMYSDKCKWGKCLKMHDMFRNVALWIASKDSRTILVDPTKDLNTLYKEGSMKDCYALSLWHNDIYPFPQQLDAPKLHFILINSRYHLNLLHASFEGIKELKVMIVINNIYQYHQGKLDLPQPTEWFNNLQTLQLVGHEIGDISFVVSLRRLEILDLQYSKFKALPMGIQNLNELKLLDLSFCKIEEDCYEVIRRCSQLEELYLWGAVTLPYEFFSNDVALLKLQRYRLRIGKCYSKGWAAISDMEIIHLGGFDISNSGASIKVLLQRACFVCLEGFKGDSQSIIPGIVQIVGSMKKLTTLRLHSTSTIKCIIDTFGYDMSLQVDEKLPMLVRLELSKMDNLKEVCRGPPLFRTLEKLESVDIRECSQLRNIFSGTWKLCNLKSLTISRCAKLMALFSMSVAQSLMVLEDLDVDSCNELKHIIIEERQDEIEAIEGELLPNLKSILVKNCGNLEDIFLQRQKLCNLKSLKIYNCEKFMTVFPMSVARSRLLLEDLQVTSCRKLMHIIIEVRQNAVDAFEEEIFLNLKSIFVRNCDMLEYIFPESQKLRNLKSLKIYVCEELTALFPMSVAQSLSSLEDLEVELCHKLKHIIMEERQNRTGVVEVGLFPNLKSISVINCSKLEHIFLGNLKLCNLKTLYIENCALLTSLFSISAAQTLLLLEDVYIAYCRELHCVFGEQNVDYGSSHQHEIMLPALKEITLRSLSKLVSICPDNFSFRWPSLIRLSCTNCTKLTTLCKYSMVGLEPTPLHSNMGSNAAATKVSQSSNEVSTHCQKLEILMLNNLFELSFIWMDSPQILGLQYLKQLEVRRCRRLKSIFSMAISKHFLQLTKLVIFDCRELEEIMAENEEVLNLSNPQPCFPRLIHLEVVHCDKLKCLFNTQQEFPKLKHLDVEHCDKLKCLFNTESFFLELEWFKVKQCDELNCLFNTQQEFPKLKHLDVEHCDKLKCLFNTEAFFPELEWFEVKRCDELKCLFNTQQDFPKLKHLDVEHCDKLKCLFSTSTPIMLPNLEYLHISNVAQLEHAFRYRNEIGTIVTDKIMLPKLRTVELNQLPNFVDISEGLKLHEVEPHRIVINNCPKFARILAQRIPFHPWREFMELQPLATADEQDLSGEEQKKVIFTSNVQVLYLNYFPELMFICKGPTLISFQNLEDLSLVGCSKLKSIFSDAVVASLPQLKKLRIEDCEELEEIISSSAQGGKCHCRISPKSCSQHVYCFSSLAKVWVRNCNKIKFLFSISMVEHLQQLEHLEITVASQFEYIFSCGRETHYYDRDVVIFELPSLKVLRVHKVPRFIDVVCGLQSQCHCPALQMAYPHELLPSLRAVKPGESYNMYDYEMDPLPGDMLIAEIDTDFKEALKLLGDDFDDDSL